MFDVAHLILMREELNALLQETEEYQRVKTVVDERIVQNNLRIKALSTQIAKMRNGR